MKRARFQNRDLSWLLFNHRVLQEAADPRVPLYERIKFLAVFSSNLDEFFRIRVASLRTLMSLKKRTKKKLDTDPAQLLKQIHKIVERHQEEFGRVFREQILKELRRQKVFLMNENQLTPSQREMVRRFAAETVVKHLSPVFLEENKEPPFLNNRSIYFAIDLLRKPLKNDSLSPPAGPGQVALVEIPTPPLPRFYRLPDNEQRFTVMFLDDMIRVALPSVFPHHEVRSVHAIKLTRDAELDLGDEYSENLIEKIKKAVAKRRTGLPSRFLYDPEMPPHLLKILVSMFGLRKEDLVRGWRYHNFSDFLHFPNPFEPEFRNPALPPLSHPGLQSSSSLFKATENQEHLLLFPYHSYDPVIRFLREAAEDPSVTSVFITLYRVARNSRIVHELLRAARNGKSVTAVVEIKARFDEESNIRWTEELERAGVRVQYRFPGMKVHAKLCLVTRTTPEGTARTAYLSTGNFNEDTASLYSDFGYFTSDDRLTAEVAGVFTVLLGKEKKPKFKHLLVAPFTMRKKFIRLIRRELKNARAGKKGSIIMKVNSLEDPEMIEELYRASRAGVDVSLIVRGICCLIPGVRGMSPGIKAMSIVDRFLEHARVFLFENGGRELCYLSSADWMTRNLRRRIEVAFPIRDEQLIGQIKTIIQMQLNDSVKGRVIDRSQNNTIRNQATGKPLQSQIATYHFLSGKTPREEIQFVKT